MGCLELQRHLLNNNDFIEFEKTVIQVILSDGSEAASKLLQQYKVATIIDRVFTGVGFYTIFEVSDKSLALDTKNIVLGCLGEMDSVKYGIDLGLHIKDGLLSYLEGSAYGESWPEKIGRIKLWLN
jgi:hypothetical protein